MKEKSKSIFKKFITCFMVLVTVCTTLLTNATTAFASELALDERTEYGYTGVSPFTGYAINHNIYDLFPYHDLCYRIIINSYFGIGYGCIINRFGCFVL